MQWRSGRAFASYVGSIPGRDGPTSKSLKQLVTVATAKRSATGVKVAGSPRLP